VLLPVSLTMSLAATLAVPLAGPSAASLDELLGEVSSSASSLAAPLSSALAAQLDVPRVGSPAASQVAPLVAWREALLKVAVIGRCLHCWSGRPLDRQGQGETRARVVGLPDVSGKCLWFAKRTMAEPACKIQASAMHDVAVARQVTAEGTQILQGAD